MHNWLCQKSGNVTPGRSDGLEVERQTFFSWQHAEQRVSKL